MGEEMLKRDEERSVETSMKGLVDRVQMINLSCWLVRGEVSVKVIKRSFLLRRRSDFERFLSIFLFFFKLVP